MKKVLYFLDHIEEYMLVILMACMSTVVFIQVVFRVLGKSLPWSEEFTRYSAVWITFVGASLGVKRGAHVGVEALKIALPKWPRRILELFSVICMIGLALIIIVYSSQIISTQITMGQKSPAMRIPMWWAYIGMPIGMVLAIIRCIQVGIGIFKGEKDADHEEAGKEG